jgi:hypothetical protein
MASGGGTGSKKGPSDTARALFVLLQGSNCHRLHQVG